MNIEQMRARIEEIQAKIEEYCALESLNDEDTDAIEVLNTEFNDLKKQIVAKEKLEEMKNSIPASTGRKVTPEAPKATDVRVGRDRRTQDPKAGFNHAGDFFKAVVSAASGQVDKRLTIQGGHQEKIGEDGGFLIPADFRSSIVEKVTGDDSLLPRTRQFQTSSNNLIMPTSEVAPWDATSGIQAYWEGEAAAFTESKHAFGETQLRLHKLTALVRATDEILEDAAALESYIKNEAPNAMMHKVNSAIIDGTGSGMPLGFLGSGFKIEVAKESGQTADTVLFANVNKMLGRLLPQSYANAVWLCHPEVLPQLRAMQFVDGATSPVPVYMPPGGVSEAPYGTLYGRPIVPMMGGVKALGDAGDIVLVDLNHYMTAMKTAGVKSDISTHVYFSTQEVAFRFSMRLAGQCPFKAPVTTENGSYTMSGIITLAARA